jgi:membrane peptidoglycan carboxypeptidase
MIDMMQVYGTFANGGITVEEDPFLEILDYKGRTLYHNSCALDKKCNGIRTLSEATAYQISSILSDNNARTPAFGAQSVLYIPEQEVAVKTGTTNNLRDNWTFGYTNDLVVGVWVGNNNNQPMSYVASGVTGASPIWQKIMMMELEREEEKNVFLMPSGVVKVSYCGREEIFKVGAIPAQVCKSGHSGENPPTYPEQTQDR